MDFELWMRNALVLESPGDDFDARVMARLDKRQVIDIRARRGRYVAVGTIVVIGVAAAMMILRLSGPARNPAGAVPPYDSMRYGEKAGPPAASVPEPAAAAPDHLPPTELGAEHVVPVVVDLPLVPPPATRPTNEQKVAMALQAAVERHPELVSGPHVDNNSMFFVSIALHRNGEVITSAAELAASADVTEVEARMAQALPFDPAGEQVSSYVRRGERSPDGRVMRAGVFLSAIVTSDSFDLARSDLRVRQILGRQFDAQMTTIDSSETNMLTIFLSDDGKIVREKVEQVTSQNADVVLGAGIRLNETIAAKLGLDVEQIGQVGRTALQEGVPKLVEDPSGLKRVEGVRMLSVRYAWERRPEEPAAIHTARHTDEPKADFDLAAALVVAEQLFPDAFSHAPSSLADWQPTVVFTAKGEVLRAGRVRMRNGVESDSLLQEQLVPGVSTGLHRWSIRLTNKDGATAVVGFAWAE